MTRNFYFFYELSYYTRIYLKKIYVKIRSSYENINMNDYEGLISGTDLWHKNSYKKKAEHRISPYI